MAPPMGELSRLGVTEGAALTIPTPYPLPCLYFLKEGAALAREGDS